ncbi:MAG: hypothetical protein EOM76_07670 [Sphingobacteriia bacterium]|nr:hypothetical protein [Sphingobacteriia bacterium]
MSILITTSLLILTFEVIFFKKKESKQIRIIFYSCFLFYSLYMILFTYSYVKNPSFQAVPFDYIDQIHFFRSANFLSYSTSSLSELYNSIASKKSYINTGGLYYAILAYWYKLGSLFGGPNIYTMKLLNIWALSIAMVFFYKIFRIFTHEKDSLKFILLFSFFSHALFLSQPLLRDNFVTLLSFMVIYICLLPFSVQKFFISLMLSAICFGLRLENGILLLIITLFSPLEKKQSRINFYIFITFLIFILFLIGNYAISIVSNTTEGYSLRTQQSFKPDSITQIAYLFPNGIRQIIGLLLGLIQPFPIITIENLKEFNYFLFLIPERVAIIFTLLCLCFILFSGKIIQNINYLNNKQKIILIICVLAIAASSVDFSHRRVMGLYPLIYLLAYKSYISTTEIQKQYIFLSTFLGFTLLHGLYFIIKP